MIEDEREERGEQERPRPRVVDKRVSARGADAARTEPEPSPVEAPPTAEPPPREPGPAEAEPAAGPGPVWTPEQEAEAQAMMQQIAETPAVNWVVNSAMTLVDVASTKLQTGQLSDAQLAIDGLSALLQGLAGRLSTAETPLRNVLAQLQLAYTETAGGGSPGQGGG